MGVDGGAIEGIGRKGDEAGDACAMKDCVNDLCCREEVRMRREHLQDWFSHVITMMRAAGPGESRCMYGVKCMKEEDACAEDSGWEGCCLPADVLWTAATLLLATSYSTTSYSTTSYSTTSYPTTSYSTTSYSATSYSATR